MKRKSTPPPHAIIIYTDGSCLGNPGPGGWAAIVQIDAKETILSGHEPHTTNNRMEMTAIIEALEWVKKHKYSDRILKIFSDSSLVIKSLNDGWKRKSNLDLWMRLDELAHELNCQWNWVKGHADDVLNQRCDEIAVNEAMKAQKEHKKKHPLSSASPNESDPKAPFRCSQCHTVSQGKLGYLSESKMIRVDCPACGRYIKFAPPTPENIKRAKQRPLLTKSQLESILSALKSKGVKASEELTKKLKSMTLVEVKDFLKRA